MHGAGNDYIYVNTLKYPIDNPEHLSKLWSDRHKGIGGDGLVLMDNPEKKEYPMPLFLAGKDPVYVGRIRKDLANPNGLTLWLVSDQIRKGAALNAVQIAEYLIKVGDVK